MAIATAFTPDTSPSHAFYAPPSANPKVTFVGSVGVGVTDLKLLQEVVFVASLRFAKRVFLNLLLGPRASSNLVCRLIRMRVPLFTLIDALPLALLLEQFLRSGFLLPELLMLRSRFLGFSGVVLQGALWVCY